MGKQKASKRCSKSTIPYKGRQAKNKKPLSRVLESNYMSVHDENMKELVQLKKQYVGGLHNKKKRVGVSLRTRPRRRTMAARISHALMTAAIGTQEVGTRHRGTFFPAKVPSVHKWVI